MRAEPVSDKSALGLTLFWENDGAWSKWGKPTDGWYTAGVGMALQWQGTVADELVGSLPSIGEEFSPHSKGTSYAMGATLVMDIYTPQEITDPEIRPKDRPYAGWTYAGLIAQRANRAATVPVYEHLELDVGMLGPSSNAEETQKWAHRTFSGDYPEGWAYQVKDEVGVDFRYQRRWRIDIGKPKGNLAMQLIPDAGLGVGTIHTLATAGATLRYGWKLPDDFGPGNVRTADDFTRPIGKVGVDDGLSVYFFGRPGVKLVAHDATLGDSWFRDNIVSVDNEPLVAQLTGGIAVAFSRHWRLSYAYTLMGPEFQDRSAWHSFASISLSAFVQW